MSWFMVIFKVFPYLMPFIKEMLIGKKSWKQAFRENRIKTTVVVGLAISLLFNLVLMAKIGSLAMNLLEMSRAKQQLEERVQVLEVNKAGTPSSPRHPVASNTEVQERVPTKVTPRSDSADSIRAEFERMRQRESSEH